MSTFPHAVCSVTPPPPFIWAAVFSYCGHHQDEAARGHHGFQFTVVLKGRFLLDFSDGETCELLPGDLIVVAPGVKHLWRSAESETTEVLALFCGGLSTETFGDLAAFLGPQISDQRWKIQFPLDRGRALAGDLLRLDRSQGPAKLALLYALCCRMIAEFGEALAARYPAPQAPIPPNLVAALYLVERRYQTPLTLGALAKAAGLSVSRFSALFQEHFSESPMRYLNRFRLGRACHLLEHTAKPVQEIAAACGFSSQHYFAHQFQKRYQQSPTTFRSTTHVPTP